MGLQLLGAVPSQPLSTELPVLSTDPSLPNAVAHPLFCTAVENVRGHNEYSVSDCMYVSLIAQFICREWLPTVM